MERALLEGRRQLAEAEAGEEQAVASALDELEEVVAAEEVRVGWID